MLKSENIEPLIIVIGIDDSGVNTVNYMVEQGLQGVQLIGIDVDAQRMTPNMAPSQLHVGIAIADGLRGSNIHSVVQSDIEEFRLNIKTLICKARIVFIAAEANSIGVTCIAPVIAKIAQDLNILTVAVVTKPFAQQYDRLQPDDEGIKTLYEQVDGMIIVPNIQATERIGNNLTAQEYFADTNYLIHRAVVSVAGNLMSNGHCYCCFDIEDICTMLSNTGIVMMAEAVASGQDRARCAANQAVQSILMQNLDRNSVYSAFMIILTANRSFTLGEYKEVMEYVKSATQIENCRVALTEDESMDDELRVTVFATARKVTL